MILNNPIPEPGQIVTVRQRRYVVSDIIPSALPPDPFHRVNSEP